MDKELTLKLLEDTQEHLFTAIGGMGILGLDATKAIEVAREYVRIKEQLVRDMDVGGITKGGEING